MKDFTVIARLEPTTDDITLKLWPNTKKTDVQIYRSDGSKFARFPWYYSSKPRRNQKSVMLNCFRWNLVWEVR